MATAAPPSWAYTPRPSDPDEVKSVNNESLSKLIDKVGSVDSIPLPFVKALWFNNGSMAESVGNRLTVDFRNGKVEFPASAVSSCLPLPNLSVDFVRYAAFLNVSDCEVVSGGHQVVVVSTWENQDKNIHNIYFILNLDEALMLTNAVSRLVSQESLKRTKILYPLLCGKVKVATCDSKRHSEKGECCDPERVMPFTADRESLGFYENQFSNCPQFDFRFYKEQGPRSIDVIMINKTHGHIQVRQGLNIYVIKKCPGDEESFDKLVAMFKENVIKSHPEKYFAHPEKLEPAHSQPEKFFAYPEKSEPAHSQPEKFFAYPQKMESSYSASQLSRPQEYSQEPVWESVNPRHFVPEWLDDLHTGKHLDVSKDENMLVIWCTIEHDLKECIESGTVPFTNPESGGLDPNSLDHLQRSVEDIKDHLFQANVSTAMSRLRACLAVFGSTLLEPVEKLEEVEFLKRIYFLSGKD